MLYSSGRKGGFHVQNSWGGRPYGPVRLWTRWIGGTSRSTQSCPIRRSSMPYTLGATHRQVGEPNRCAGGTGLCPGTTLPSSTGDHRAATTKICAATRGEVFCSPPGPPLWWHAPVKARPKLTTGTRCSTSCTGSLAIDTKNPPVQSIQRLPLDTGDGEHFQKLLYLRSY
jgi:hypothetical protein